MTAPQQFTHSDDLIAIWRHYVQTVLTPPEGEADPACKALVADDNAMRMLTVACPMTLLMEYRIYDIHSLEQLLETGHRTALSGEETAYILLCPTPQSQDKLLKLIQRNIFAAHHVVYTNRSDDAALVSLAMHDTLGPGGLPKIASIKDAFADFLPIDRHLFLTPSPTGGRGAAEPVRGSSPPWRRAAAEAATAVAAALRCAPVVRYQATSERAGDTARAIADIVGSTGNKRVYDFSKKATVLILDRCGDAVTPLLTPWSYAAMLHELLDGGIADNTVQVPDAAGKPERFVVGPAADDFYGAHASDDYGAIGGALGAAARRQFAAVEGLKSKAGEEVSVARMRQRLDESAASSAAKTLLARHMSMFEVVAERVKRRGLLEVGASEQSVAAGPDGSAAAIAAVKAAAELHASGGTTAADVTRLALLACLRFEERTGDVCAAARPALGASLEPLASALLAYGGAARRTEDLFSGGLLGNVRRMMGGQDADVSAFAQHTPLLRAQLDAVADGKLDPKKYPVVGEGADDVQRATRVASAQVVVVMLGGATYSEHEAVQKFNAARRRADRRCNAALGASAMLNTSAFVDRVRTLVQ